MASLQQREAPHRHEEDHALHAREIPGEDEVTAEQEASAEEQVEIGKAVAAQDPGEDHGSAHHVERGEGARPGEREAGQLEDPPAEDHVAGRHPHHVSLWIELRSEQRVAFLHRDRLPQEAALVGPGNGEAEAREAVHLNVDREECEERRPVDDIVPTGSRPHRSYSR
jgi:hypothetical protein